MGSKKKQFIVWSKWRSILQHTWGKAQQPGDVEQSLGHTEYTGEHQVSPQNCTLRPHKGLRSSNSLKLKAPFIPSTEDLLYSQSYSEVKPGISLALRMAFLGWERTSQEQKLAQENLLRWVIHRLWMEKHCPYNNIPADTGKSSLLLSWTTQLLIHSQSEWDFFFLLILAMLLDICRMWHFRYGFISEDKRNLMFTKDLQACFIENTSFSNFQFINIFPSFLSSLEEPRPLTSTREYNSSSRRISKQEEPVRHVHAFLPFLKRTHSSNRGHPATQNIFLFQS